MNWGEAVLDIVSRSFLKAMQDLQDAAEEMDAAVSETRALQANHDAALKRLLDLISRANENASAHAGRASHQAQSAKYTQHTRTLDKQRAAMAETIKSYTGAKAAFDDLFQSQSLALAEQAHASFRQQKREAALARMIESMVQKKVERQESAASAPEFDQPHTSHGYIPLGIDHFLNLLISLDMMLAMDEDYASPDQRYRPVSFLEVGCGQGRIMYLAQQSRLLNCASVEGFDFNPKLVALGRAALDLGETIFVQDAMAFDYTNHDIIYSYRPFFDADLQSRLEARIARQMKPGAYLLAPSAQDLDRHPQLTRMVDALPIWKKTG